MYPSDHLRVHDPHPGQGKIKFFYPYLFDSWVHRYLLFAPVKVEGSFFLNERVPIYIMREKWAKNIAYPDKICILTTNVFLFTLFFLPSTGISS